MPAWTVPAAVIGLLLAFLIGVSALERAGGAPWPTPTPAPPTAAPTPTFLGAQRWEAL
jgi:hypothetical protein